MARTVGLVFKSVENVENTEKTLEDLTVAQLKEKATALGLNFANNIKKDALIALIEDAENAPETPEVDPEETETPDENPEVNPDGEE